MRHVGNTSDKKESVDRKLEPFNINMATFRPKATELNTNFYFSTTRSVVSGTSKLKFADSRTSSVDCCYPKSILVGAYDFRVAATQNSCCETLPCDQCATMSGIINPVRSRRGTERSNNHDNKWALLQRSSDDTRQSPASIFDDSTTFIYNERRGLPQIAFSSFFLAVTLLLVLFSSSCIISVVDCMPQSNFYYSSRYAQPPPHGSSYDAQPFNARASALSSSYDAGSSATSLAPARFGADQEFAGYPEALPAGCQPMLQAVPVPLDGYNYSITAEPACVQVKRCSGCCSAVGLKCVPVKTSSVVARVALVSLTASNGLNVLGEKSILMESHDKCQCECQVHAGDCSRRQRYDAEGCVCQCKNEAERRNCMPPQDWDPNLCECRCTQIRRCGAGLIFDQKACECFPDNG